MDSTKDNNNNFSLFTFRSFFISICIFLTTTSCFGQDSLGRTLFCEKCKCLNKTKSNPDVDCSEVPMAAEWFEPKYYNNNGTVFPILSLNLQNSNLREISKRFPTSGLKKLDLSHNYIKTIGDMVFANLTELEELDLSYNNLDAINSKMLMVSKTKCLL